jgi:hypothetical protein
MINSKNAKLGAGVNRGKSRMAEMLAAEISRRYARLGHQNFRTHSSNPNAAGLFCSHATWARASGCLSVPRSMTTY